MRKKNEKVSFNAESLQRIFLINPVLSIEKLSFISLTRDAPKRIEMRSVHDNIVLEFEEKKVKRGIQCDLLIML